MIMKKTKLVVSLALMLSLSAGVLAGCGGHEHTYSDEWTMTETHHYHAATCDDADTLKAEEMKDYGEHVYSDDTDTTCNTCGYERTLTPAVETGTIVGTVKAYDKALSGVKVAVGDNDTVTSATGAFSLGGVVINDEVEITFTKTNYADKTVTVKKEDWSDKAVDLGTVTMNLAVEEGTLTGVVKVGDTVLEGASVKLGDQEPVTTDSEGKYTVEHISTAAAGELDFTVTHPMCVTYADKVEITAGTTAFTKDVDLTAKTVSELGGATLFELNALPTAAAADHSFMKTELGGSGIDGWTRVGESEQSNEGLLFIDAGLAESGSTELKLYAYKRYSFTGLEEITVKARRFSDPTHNPNLSGYPEIYIYLIGEDGTFVAVNEDPAEVTNGEACDDLVFTLSAPITGNYIFAVGTTRGNRVAVEEVRFRGEFVNGDVTGTIVRDDSALAGVSVTFGTTTVMTANDGTFTIPVSVRKGGSDIITFTYEDVQMEVSFTAEDLSNGVYALGERELKALPLPGITQEQLDALTAVAAADVTSVSEAQTAFASWVQVGRDNGSANEGWLLRDAGYAEFGTAELKVFMYQKLTFTNMQTIRVRARTFTNQNDVGEIKNVHPELILKLIDSEGNAVDISYNVALVDTDSDTADFYFVLEEAITGDYVLAIGMARGQRLAIGGISYLAPSAMVSGTVTGTVLYGTSPAENATVSFTYGYNVKGEVQTNSLGEFTLPVMMGAEDEVTVTILTAEANGSFTVTAEDLADGTYAKGEVSLAKRIIEGFTTADFETLEPLTGTKFEAPNGDSKILETWQIYGTVENHNEGACIEIGATKPVSYLYAKFMIDEAHSYMKFNTRMFLRGHQLGASDMEDQPVAIKVTVIQADGTATVLTPVGAYRSGNNVSSTNIIGDTQKLLLNNDDNYTEGVYDLTAYAGKEVVIVIEAVYHEDSNGLQTHNAINEIAFKSNPFYTDVTVTGTVKDETGALEGATVSIGNTSVTTDANGLFRLSVVYGAEFTGEITVTVSKDNFRSQTFAFTLNDLNEGSYSPEGDITLEAVSQADIILPGLTKTDVEALAVSNGEDRGTQLFFGKNGSTFNGWQSRNTLDSGNDVGIDFDGYIYAKVQLGEYVYLKFNDAMKDGVGGKLAVYVIQNGELVAVPLVKVYPDPSDGDSRIENGNVLVNTNRDGRNTYEEGVFDFSQCETDDDGCLVIVICTLPLNDGDTQAYNGANELAFFKTENCDK